MKKLPLLLACPIAAAALLGVALPAYASGNNCQFQARGLSMSFGALNPASGSDVTVAVSASTPDANRAGDCNRTMTISGDNGLNFSGSRRLKNTAGTDFIAYSLVGLPVSLSAGNGSYALFTFSGTIPWSAYANASAGSYSDTVLISVTP
ncbi:MAG: spore coat protein U domain-containing protein [Polaromonas sp.]